MRAKIRKGLKLLLVIVFIFSLGMVLMQQFQNHSAQNSYEQAEELASEEKTTVEERTTEAPTEATEPETTEEETRPAVWQAVEIEDDPYMEELAQKNLEALREVNTEVLGWIWIPGTNVDYPVMDGDDNDYYLEHTWDRQPSTAGSICLEKLNSSDLSDFNTLFYGHRMNNGSMFGSLKYYNDMDYFSEHPYVYVLDDNGVHRYEIFSAYTAPVDGSTFIYGFRSEESMQAFLDYCVEKSVIDTGIVPTLDDRILTLVTCTGRGYEARWVVQTRLEGVEDNPRKLYGQETEPAEEESSLEERQASSESVD